MAKIHPKPHTPPLPHRPQAAPTPTAEKSPPAERQEATDSFVASTVRQVYESNPLVMLCTKPDLRKAASAIPVVKEIADAVCPAVIAVDQAIAGSK